MPIRKPTPAAAKTAAKTPRVAATSPSAKDAVLATSSAQVSALATAAAAVKLIDATASAAKSAAMPTQRAAEATAVPAPKPAIKPNPTAKLEAAPTSKAAATPKAAPKLKAAPISKAAPKPKAAPVPKAAPKPKAAPVPKAAPKPKASAKPKASPAPKPIPKVRPAVAPKAAAAKPPKPPKPAPGVRGVDGRYLKSLPAAGLVVNDGRRVAVVHLSAELAPIARTGGLGEVVTSLAAYQAAAGMDVSIVIPLYRQIRAQFPGIEPVGAPFITHINEREHGTQLYQLPVADAAEIIGMRGAVAPPRVYFIDNRDFFDRDGIYADERGNDYTDSARRYGFFCAAAMQILPTIASAPVLLHAHDWHTCLALAYLRTWYADSSYHRDVSTVLTVHNAAYQGHFSADTMRDVGLPTSLYNYEQFEWYGRMNMLKGGMAFADAVTTVSPTHADELRTEDGGFGVHQNFLAKKDRFVGILNGIDQSRWDSANDPDTGAAYTREDLGNKAVCRVALQQEFGLAVRADVPIFVMTARLVQQKGLELILANPWIFNADAQWVFLGNGDRRYVDGLRAIAARLPDRVAVETHFSDVLEHRLMAGGDVLLMPCQYEPCGLTQMRAQRYGTVPLVRRVGGLADTVHDGVTGFVFNEFAVGAFAECVARAIVVYRDQAQWTRMMRDGMARDFGWERSEERYRDLYRTVLTAR